jgi:thiosulfate/3-mercaptopyruvate sulfurtransferase
MTSSSTRSGAHAGAQSVPPIVTVDWLLGRRDSTAGPLVVCEVGSTMAGGDPDADHRSGHLPGALLVVLDDVLADPPSATAGRHPLPSPEEFARRLGATGIADDATVVAYDRRAGGGLAARLVWMLRVIGQPAALLSGGLEAWGRPREAGDVAAGTVVRTVRAWPSTAVADADTVAEHIRAGGIVIDSRDPSRYSGDNEPIDPIAGHVPGAINLPYTDNLDEHGRFRPDAELIDRFAGATGDDHPIVYCGSGVTACHNALAMEHAGLGPPRVYVGSWSGWSADHERPIATGPNP